MFTSDKLKIEPWLINGWQSYGKFNEMPGFGAQILYRPTENISVLSNDYVGWDTQDHPGRFRFHTDNSFQYREYENKSNPLFNRAAFSITADLGGESGDGVTPFGGSGTEGNCSAARPCTQNFLSAMAYHRLWFLKGKLAWTVGGGLMHNPGRYLILAPPGNASAVPQPLNTAPATDPFDTSPGLALRRLRLRERLSVHARPVPDLGAGVQPPPDAGALLRRPRWRHLTRRLHDHGHARRLAARSGQDRQQAHRRLAGAVLNLPRISNMNMLSHYSLAFALTVSGLFVLGGCDQGNEGDRCNPDLSHNECNSGLVCSGPGTSQPLACVENYCCPDPASSSSNPYCNGQGCPAAVSSGDDDASSPGDVDASGDDGGSD